VGIFLISEVILQTLLLNYAGSSTEYVLLYGIRHLR
jgi:hypothetical protein